jgi:Tfp pilus assembly protein PilF
LHEHLAFTYLQTGCLDDAVTQLREAVRLAPEDAGAHALLAQTPAQDGRLPEAIEEQKFALSLKTEDAES